jgi:hypothetical protein
MFDFRRFGQSINQNLGQSYSRNKNQNDYDYLGWASNGGLDSAGQMKQDGLHFPDTYKMPNHQTFSDQSIYANGGNKNLAGSWDESSNPYFNSANYLPSFSGFMSGKMPQREVWYEQPSLNYQLQLQQLLGGY